MKIIKNKIPLGCFRKLSLDYIKDTIVTEVSRLNRIHSQKQHHREKEENWYKHGIKRWYRSLKSNSKGIQKQIPQHLNLANFLVRTKADSIPNKCILSLSPTILQWQAVQVRLHLNSKVRLWTNKLILLIVSNKVRLILWWYNISRRNKHWSRVIQRERSSISTILR
jgi:hypothetical protein